MNTIFIYDSLGVDYIRFFVRDGDYSHLDGTYINQCGRQDELMDLIGDWDVFFNKLLDKFPHGKYTEGNTVVITVGLVQ